LLAVSDVDEGALVASGARFATILTNEVLVLSIFARVLFSLGTVKANWAELSRRHECDLGAIAVPALFANYVAG